MAFLLGLITSRWRKDLDQIRSIRNRFAHSHLGQTFEDQSIMDMIDALETPKMFKGSGIMGIVENPTQEDRRRNARSRFNLTAALLSQDLLIAARKAQHLQKMGR